jgi:rhodanese-related sulfurtransferase
MLATIKTSVIIVLLAAAAALAFNLITPQGLAYLPPEVAQPLWQPADAASVKRQVDNGARLVDARPAGDYNRKRVRGALKIPFDNMAAIYALLDDTLGQAPAVVVYGRSFSRFPAATVGQFLRSRGLAQVFVTEASLEEMEKAGLPLLEPARRDKS